MSDTAEPTWPSIALLPVVERQPFSQWLIKNGCTCPSTPDGDGYYEEDYQAWKAGRPAPD